MVNKNYVHFIGMAGTAMAPVAKMMYDMGWKVTGSDKGFYPPVSDYLKNNHLICMPGYKSEHITNPNLIVLGNAVPLSNPEYLEAKSKNIKIISFPELLGKYLVKKNSIVVAGAYGKTTTTALITWILTYAKFNPSYLIGGIALNFEDGIKNINSDWSVLEGDEYNAVKYDKSPKFLYYKPKYVVLSAASWDHIDLYPTEEEYVKSFVNLVKLIPKDGLLVIKENGENIDKIISQAKCKILKYSNNLFQIKIENSKTHLEYNGINFEVKLIGKHNIENITAAFTLAKNLGISESIIIEALKEFRGVKRRLEIKANINDILVIDDFAHTAVKAKASINAVKEWYTNRKIWAIFEPHSMTARTKQSMEWFKNTFDDADYVIIGDIYKTNSLDAKIKASSEGIVEIIQKENNKKIAIKDVTKITEKIKNEVNPGDIVLIMSSGSFSGLIANIVESLKNKYNK